MRRRRNQKIGPYKFKNKFEQFVFKQLPEESVYERDRNGVPLTIHFTQDRTYLPDFRLPNGIYIEAKGKFASKDRTKHLLVRKQKPELDIRFVFCKDNLLSKKSSTRYSGWCEQYGFKWCLNTIPLEWFLEKEKEQDAN